jgi:hypothetical protein
MIPLRRIDSEIIHFGRTNHQPDNASSSLPRASLLLAEAHTSGLIDYEDVIPEIFAAQLHDADVVRLLETQDRTYFTPWHRLSVQQQRLCIAGTDALLALIVERACLPVTSHRLGTPQSADPCSCPVSVSY